MGDDADDADAADAADAAAAADDDDDAAPADADAVVDDDDAADELASLTEDNTRGGALAKVSAAKGFGAALRVPETRGKEARPDCTADELAGGGCGGEAALASLAAAMRCVAIAAIAAAVDAGIGETGSARLAFSVIILRRDAKLSTMPASSLLLVSSKTPSNAEAVVESDRRELDAAVMLGSS
jgi:hypothetical protein